MTRTEAISHATGYAAGREDASGIRTYGSTADTSGFYQFALAYAAAWEQYNTEQLSHMRNCRDCYETWQETHGCSVFAEEVTKR